MSKRRGHGEGSVYQRSRDGKWVAQIDLGYVDGKRKRPYRTADTRQEAHRLLREMQGEIEQGATAIDPRMTLGIYLRKWLKDDVEYRVRAGRLRPATAESYERLVRVHLIPALGHVRLIDLSPMQVQGCYDGLLQDLKASSVGKVHQVLRGALDHAVRDRALVANPTDRVAVPRQPREEATSLTLDDVRAIRQNSAGTLDHALWTTMAGCGLRLGEALGLRWMDLDLEAGILNVEQTLGVGKGGIRFGPPKSAKGRRAIPLIADVTSALRRHRALVNKRRLSATRWDEDCPAVFPSQVGTWQLPSNVQRRFRKMRSALGLSSDVRPHTLRHTYASMLFEAGVDLVAIQELLGHANLATTRDLYVHLSEKVRVEAAHRLQQWLDEHTI